MAQTECASKDFKKNALESQERISNLIDSLMHELNELANLYDLCSCDDECLDRAYSMTGEINTLKEMSKEWTVEFRRKRKKHPKHP